jgi:hypothetical protein
MEGGVLSDLARCTGEGARCEVVMSGPLVSVVMAVRNDLEHVPSAISCLRSQSYRDWEAIVVDDCSDDGTAEYLSAVDDPRIRVVLNAEHGGQTRCLNQALDLASGDFIARQDSDDTSRADRFARQVTFLTAHPETILIGTAATVYDENGQVIGAIEPGLTDGFLRWMLPFGNPMVHSSFMWRTRIGAASPLRYEEAFHWAQDYRLLTQALGVGRIANLAEPLVGYLVRSDSMTRVGKVHQDNTAERISLLALRQREVRGSDAQLSALRKIACGAAPAVRPCEVMWAVRAFMRLGSRYLRQLKTESSPESLLAAGEVRGHMARVGRIIVMHFARREPSLCIRSLGVMATQAPTVAALAVADALSQRCRTVMAPLRSLQV